MAGEAKVLRVGHSPDPDDAFMVWALTRGAVGLKGWRLEQVAEDIQGLNRRARKGELELTAISAGAYPAVADKYGILRCGASLGRNYGPVLVSKAFPSGGVEALRGKRIAVPGEDTTAFLVLRLALPDFQPVQADFTEIFTLVENGAVDAGLVIHEGQLTYREKGFYKVLDLGAWWQQQTGLPLPLGLDVVRRDLGAETIDLISRAMKESIDYALEHEDEAVGYAAEYGRGIDLETARRFVRMYVNRDTQDLQGEGLAGLRRLYEMAVQRGLLAKVPDLTLY